MVERERVRFGYKEGGLDTKREGSKLTEMQRVKQVGSMQRGR